MFFIHFNRKRKQSADIDAQKIQSILSPYSQPDRSGVLTQGGAWAAQCLHWNTPQSKFEQTPFWDEASQVLVAAWARLDNREDLARHLNIDTAEMAALGESAVILNAWQKWGEDCVHYLIGDFVFVIYDLNSQTLFCARDHLGVRPFYYYLSDEVFVCSTSQRALIECHDVPVKIRQAWLADFLAGLNMSFDETPYENVMKLPPAHCLRISPQNNMLSQYFNLADTEPLRLNTSEDYVDAYREILEEAIRCRLVSDYKIGSELSGGVDSSTVTAYAAKMMHDHLDDLHAFAFAHLKMEPEYIFAVSQAYGLPLNHVVTGFAGSIDSTRSLNVMGAPVEHGNATGHEPFYELAETFNVRTLLSGFGGDEFGTTIHSDLVLRELMVQRKYRQAMNLMRGSAPFRFLRVIQLFRRQIKSGNFAKEQYRQNFFHAWKQRWPRNIVRNEWVEQYELKRRYFDTARFDAGYTDLKKFTLEKRWQPFVPTRMDNCTQMAAAHQIEYRWPLLDVRLVQCFLAIPSIENRGPGIGRYLHRRAIQDVVPDLVAWKRNKWMGDRVMQDGGMMFGQAKAVDRKNLHPMLKDLIDIEKYEQQAVVFDAQKGKLELNQMMPLRKNLVNIKSLNDWLMFVDP